MPVYALLWSLPVCVNVACSGPCLCVQVWLYTHRHKPEQTILWFVLVYVCVSMVCSVYACICNCKHGLVWSVPVCVIMVCYGLCLCV